MRRGKYLSSRDFDDFMRRAAPLACVLLSAVCGRAPRPQPHKEEMTTMAEAAMNPIARRAGVGVLKARRMIAALALVAVAAVPARARRGLDEDEVKATFLYNLVKFVEWPRDDKSAPLAICVAGHDPVRAVLTARASGKPVNGRQVVVRGLGDGDEARACHAIFVGAAESARRAAILQHVRHSAVLTVGETRDFLDDGGLVRFYVEAARVRFAIDPAGAQRVGLKISSQLLSLSKLGG